MKRQFFNHEFRLSEFNKSSVRRPQIWVGLLLHDALLFYCLLYTDCPDGRTDAVARHVSFVSFAQITCDANIQRAVDTRINSHDRALTSVTKTDAGVCAGCIRRKQASCCRATTTAAGSTCMQVLQYTLCTAWAHSEAMLHITQPQRSSPGRTHNAHGCSTVHRCTHWTLWLIGWAKRVCRAFTYYACRQRVLLLSNRLFYR